MDFKRNFIFLFVIFLMGFVSSSEAYNFFVGGKDGWVLKPSEGYNHWAERMRFQVNDTLYFKYKKGSDWVLVVTKEDYYSCNNKKPIQSLTDGDSVFTFDHSGPYFFISGNPDNCNKGQKLIVVVMGVRNKTHHHEAPPAPSPVSSPPQSASPPPSVSPPVEPPKSAPAPVQPPKSAPSPVQPPKSAPSPVQPPKSASSPVQPPESAPSPVQPPKSAPAPVQPPKSAPAPVQPPKSAPAPVQPPKSAPAPVKPPKSAPVQPPKSAPAPVQPPESNDPPADIEAPSPAPANSGSSGLGWNFGSVLGFSVGVSLVFGSFIGLV